MISGNTVMQRNFIFFAIKKSLLAPTELIHLFRERVLSKHLFNMIVSPTLSGTLSIAKDPRRQLDPMRTVDRHYTHPELSSA
jgi:hypothetical protein